MTRKNTKPQGNEFFDGASPEKNKGILVKPRNPRQKQYLRMISDAHTSIVFALGPAGTGKTMLAVHKAIEEYRNNNVQNIIITRPVVTVDEEIGYLPGDMLEKMQPWVRPVLDIFKDYYTKPQIDKMLKYENIEVSPLAFMRGRTFKNSFIIADEMQNSTQEQMKMLLTRIGEGSKMVVNGDPNQYDRNLERNGLKDFTDRLDSDNTGRIKLIEFQRGDIERHPVVTEVLDLYDDDDLPIF